MAEEGIDNVQDKKKPHRDPKSGRKAEKKNKKKGHNQELTDKQKNPKAFTFNSAIQAERRFRRKKDIETKKQHIPVVDRTAVEPPPIIVVIVGPPKVGKTTLIHNLIKNYTRQPLSSVCGPVTIVIGKKRRITLMECNNDINSMIDLAKIADLVLLLVDASFGFEMEIFEFLNICQVHGMPRIMGVLTHLDLLKNSKQLKRIKKTLKHRFWTEVYQGAKLFYLSGLLHGEYLKNEVKNLGRFISIIKFRPMVWRSTHPYILTDRMEDITPPENVRQNRKCDRELCLYGYVRGVALNKENSIHLPGCGDMRITDVTYLPDPCSLPEPKKRSLIEKERIVYAPFSGVGGIVYDKDAVYVELAGSHSFTDTKGDDEKEMVDSMLVTQDTIDVQMKTSELRLFSNAKAMTSAEFLTEAYAQQTKVRKEPFKSNKNDTVEETDSEEEEEERTEVCAQQTRVGKEPFKRNENVAVEETDSEEEEEERTEACGQQTDSEKEEEEEGTEACGQQTDSEEEEEEGTETCAQQTKGGKESFKSYKNYADTDSEEEEEEEKTEVCAQQTRVGKKPFKRNENDAVEETDSEEEEKERTEACGQQTDSEKEEEEEGTEACGQQTDSEEEEEERTEACGQQTRGGKESFKSYKNYADTDSEEEEEEERKRTKNFTEEQVNDGGRIRRRVVFNKQMDDVETDEESNDELSDEEEETGERKVCKGMGSAKDQDITSKISNILEKLDKSKPKPVLDSDSDFDDSNLNSKRKMEDVSNDEVNKKMKLDSREEFADSAVRWKENLAQKASDAFIERQRSTQNLWKLVYGNSNNMFEKNRSDSDDDYAERVGGIFRVMHEKEKQKVMIKETLNEHDTSIFPIKHVRDWSQESVKYLIQDCFVTGKWKKSEDAEELLKLDDMSDEEFGDFEDLETGEKHVQEKKGEKVETREELLERKKKLKEKFDSEYDNKGDTPFYDELKAQATQQAELNRSEFEGLADEVRVELEGYRPGMYVRIELSRVPYELLQNFDPTYPLIIGGLLPGEENIGFVQVRMKKHRWYKKILKNKDPVIISLGWRRFQTLPVFAKLEDNMRQRMLKYTPEHVSCMAHFFGPITPQGTGFLAVQNIAQRTSNFRIAATGVVVELDQTVQVMKKLKLIGTPLKIYKKTAFIKGMFSSILEVGKFEGAKIRTVSGVRGQIKKAVNKPEGAFRATFEDMIKLSDIVFCRTWYQVEIPKFYNPVTSLLLPENEKNNWEGMKTVGELKKELGIRFEPNPDCLYTDINRKPKVFHSLKIPKSLQEALPYKHKPKTPAGPSKKEKYDAKRVAVIREPREEKVAELMKMIKTNYAHKQEKDRETMVKRVDQHRKVMEMNDLRKLKRQKDLRKRVFRALTKIDQKNEKKRRR